MSDNPPRVQMVTSMGAMTIELDAQNDPKTVENFLKYVDSGHYDGTIFHRVIDNFMIQGGGFTAGMDQKKTQPAIQNEASNGLKNDTGTLAMARTNDPHSATSQFFINVSDNDFLNHRTPSGDGWGYCVFGKVVQGMDVVEQIKAVDTKRVGPHDDVPAEPIVIESAKRLD